MRHGMPVRLFLLLTVLCVGLPRHVALAQTQASPVAQAEPPSRQRTLVIGKITNDPKKDYQYLQPMVDFMARRLHDVGITGGAVVMAKDTTQLVQYLKQGKIDWVTETVFVALLLTEKADAEIMLRKWKKNVPEYCTVFITRHDSGIHSLTDLKGKVIAFQDPSSTTAYFIPVATLRDAGLELVELSSPREQPPADQVGYVFAREDVNISTWVHKNIVSAGAFSNVNFDDETDTPKGFKDDLKILYQTPPVPRAVELVRKGLDAKIRARLKEILLQVHNDPEAKEVLKAYEKTTQLDEFTGAALVGLEEARRILEAHRSALE